MRSKSIGFLFAVALCSSAAQAQQKSTWEIEYRVDDFTDETSIHASGYNAETGVYVSCFPQSTYYDKYGGQVPSLQVVVPFNEFLGSRGSLVDVLYRIDKNTVQTMEWTVYDEQNAVVITGESAESFTRDLLSGLLLIMQATAHSGERHKVRISLKGASMSVKQVLSACRLGQGDKG